MPSTSLRLGASVLACSKTGIRSQRPRRALACRQIAAAAATLSDSSPPGWAMRTERAARAISASPTPCPSWPSAQAQGHGQGAAGAATRPGANWSRRWARPAHPASPASTPFDQVQAEMRAHAGAQHLGRPQRRRALERQHLAKPKAAGTAQDGADIAGILHAVQDHRGRAGLQRRRPPAGPTQNPCRAGDSRPLMPANKRIRNHYVFDSSLRTIRRGLAAKMTRKTRPWRAAARAPAQRGTDGRLRARPGPACGRPCCPAPAGAGP